MQETLAMRLDAAPFNPDVIFKSESPMNENRSDPEVNKDQETETQKKLKFQLQEKLDKQILVMKAQHQFI